MIHKQRKPLSKQIIKWRKKNSQYHYKNKEIHTNERKIVRHHQITKRNKKSYISAIADCTIFLIEQLSRWGYK